MVCQNAASSILEHVGEQLRKGTNVQEDSDDFPPFFDDYSDYKGFCIAYRADLSTIIRQTSSLLPEPALSATVRRLQSALQLCSTSSAPLQVSHLLSRLHQACPDFG